MPRKKPERKADPGDDTQSFTLEMRERLKNLKLQEEKESGEARAVSETKVDDLIAKEAEDAKISGLYAMWYVDKERDRMKAEAERPDTQVLRKRYKGALERLDGKGSQEEQKSDAPAPRKRGFLELTNVQDIDELMEEARAASAAPPQQHAAAEAGAVPHGAPQAAAAAPHGQRAERRDQRPEADADDEDEGIAEYLERVQQLSKMQDRVSKRVVKSPEERRRDYEDTKFRIYGATAAIGTAGTGVAALSYGSNVAFSFGLGAVGALLYLSGLSSYTDSAETPMGNALGGRRLLVPILLVLIVQGWDKIEARVPGIADLGLEPVLLPVILGFFSYVIGEVVGGMLGKR